jgi:MoaA/NifB/PqqE/SkfB family radical SAM enzyme
MTVSVSDGWRPRVSRGLHLLSKAAALLLSGCVSRGHGPVGAPPFAYQQPKALNRKLAALRHLVKDNSIRDMPQWVSFQNTYTCNLKCPHCETHGTPEGREYHNNRERNMSDDMLGRLMAETLPTADDFTLSLSGEPLATPNFEAVLEQASQYGAKLDLITNGTLLTKRRLTALIPHARRIQISIDGATKPTFEAIRLGAKFEHVMRNVRVLTRACELIPQHLRPQISFSYTIMGSNIRELPIIVRLARDLAVPTVNCHFITVLYDYVKNETVNRHKGLYNFYRQKAVKAAQSLGVELNLPSPFAGVDPCEDEILDGSNMIVGEFPRNHYETLPAGGSFVQGPEIEPDAREIAAAITSKTLQFPSLYECDAREVEQQWATLRNSFRVAITDAYNDETKVKYCHYLHKCIYIHASGDVGPCCIIGAPTLGNAKTQSVRDIWNGDAYNDFRSRFYSDNPYDCCKDCTYITYIPRTVLLSEIVAPRPR